MRKSVAIHKRSNSRQILELILLLNSIHGMMKYSLLNCIENYSNLWHIEKAFRISKTDLKIRPIHHYLKHRIEAHISISFIAYTVYKELERIIKIHDKNLSVQKVLEEIKTIYGLEYTNPITNKKKFEVLQLNEIQLKIQNIIDLELG